MYTITLYMYTITLYMYTITLYMYTITLYMYTITLYMYTITLYMYILQYVHYCIVHGLKLNVFFLFRFSHLVYIISTCNNIIFVLSISLQNNLLKLFSNFLYYVA